jgi:predicted ABC-type transport system involved in lysophospholipase L1 biosynthesis ATPase subunit
MPLLELSHLKKSFVGPEGSSHKVIDVKYFSLAAKAQVALEGESGSGKTTFLHLIAGILKPDSGRVQIAQQEMSALSESQRDRLRAGTIGYIFQSFNLLQGYTCLENVTLAMSFGRGANRKFAQELLTRVGMGDRLHHYPRQLSTGQQQRVAVARALKVDVISQKRDNHFFVKADAYFHSGFYPTVYDNNEAFQTPHMAEDTGGVKGQNQGDESTFLGKPRDWIDAFPFDMWSVEEIAGVGPIAREAA